jgi:hypothetical protein
MLKLQLTTGTMPNKGLKITEYSSTGTKEYIQPRPTTHYILFSGNGTKLLVHKRPRDRGDHRIDAKYIWLAEVTFEGPHTQAVFDKINHRNSTYWPTIYKTPAEGQATLIHFHVASKDLDMVFDGIAEVCGLESNVKNSVCKFLNEYHPEIASDDMTSFYEGERARLLERVMDSPGVKSIFNGEGMIRLIQELSVLKASEKNVQLIRHAMNGQYQDDAWMLVSHLKEAGLMDMSKKAVEGYYD